MTSVFSEAVYLLCFLSSSLCAWMLVRQFGVTRLPVLGWSAACFFLLALSNLVVVVDHLILPDINLRTVRLLLTLTAVSILLFGFIWNAETDR